MDTKTQNMWFLP